MNSKEDYFPRLDPDPGEGMLPRKRFRKLQMEVYVFQKATNLLPPLDPPEPPMDPAQPAAEKAIIKRPIIFTHRQVHPVRHRRSYPKTVKEKPKWLEVNVTG